MANALLVVAGPRGNKVKAQLVGSAIILYTRLADRVSMSTYCYESEWEAIAAFDRLEPAALADVQSN